MSKKLIAIAAAAALALSGLVASTSANAALPIVLTEATGASYLSITSTAARVGSGTAAAPIEFAVPDSGEVTASEVLRFSVSSSLKSRPVTVTATAGIKLLDEAGNATNKYIATSGKDSLTLTTTSSGTLSFVAYPTSTSTGILTLSITDDSTPPLVDTTQVYIKGTAGTAYAIKSVTAPTNVQPEGKGTFVAVIVDAWGNEVTATGSIKMVIAGGGTGGTFTSEFDASHLNRMQYSATSKRTAGTITAGKTAGQIAVSGDLAAAGDDGAVLAAATEKQIAAFGTPVRTYFTIITTASLAGQVTALQAQVAALTAQLAESRPKATSVTKKRFNTLARKWNAANPGARVALKK
jgi:hypothetical protein